MRGDLPGALNAAVRAVKESLAKRAEGDRDPHRLRVRAGKPHPGGAGDDRRLGRPHRLQQHPHQVDEGDVGRRLLRPLHPLRHPRARHGRRHERHGAARRHHPLLRHVPGVLRLLPAVDPARRADGRARHPRHDARLRSGSARTARRTSRSSIWRRCAPSRTSTCSGPCDAVETVECWQLALEGRETPERDGADAAEPAAASPRTRRAQPLRRRRLRDFAGAGQGAGVDLRHRLGGLHRGRGAEAAGRAGRAGPRRLGAVLRAVPGAAGRGRAAP